MKLHGSLNKKIMSLLTRSNKLYHLRLLPVTPTTHNHRQFMVHMKYPLKVIKYASITYAYIDALWISDT